MSGHTPGPWTVVDGHYPSFIEVKGPSFTVSIVVSATDLDFNDFMVRHADARLIAAAPELLEALVAALPRLGHRASCISVRPASEWAENGSISAENCSCELRLVRAAIAKATQT